MAEKHASTPCSHSEETPATYLPFFDKIGDVEIYMCECGVLINIRAAKNYDNPIHAMTPEALEATIWLLIDRVLKDADNQIKEVLTKVKRQYLLTEKLKDK